MTDTRVISKFATLLPSEDYKFLRTEGIKHIEKLASKLWTDYNTHDPGITILELLCYAITELGYRSSYLIEDILADDTSSDEGESKQFFTAAEILPCNPVTADDYRKLVIDIEGVKNAWIKKTSMQEMDFYANPDMNALTYTSCTPENLVDLNGLYEILLYYENEDDSINSNIGKQVIAKLHKHRNLCEDFIAIDKITQENISVCADIELSRDANVEDTLAMIYYKISEYFSPSINFYSIDELLKKGKSADEIFEGPLLEHGFIDSDELTKADLRTELRVSDIINFIMDIKGVLAVRNFTLLVYDESGSEILESQKWVLRLSEYKTAKLLKENSKIVFYKDILPYVANTTKVENKLIELQELNKKFRLVGHDEDFKIPSGEFMDIEEYYMVQNEFPLCYGIGKGGLSDSATPKRKAQAKQLKAYLLFFEQILANYFSQLANVKQLFSINDCVDKTYFSQLLSEDEKIQELYLDIDKFRNNLQPLSENRELFEERRNRFLNHLMGRFCEEINEYGLLLYFLLKNGTNKELIKNKLAFLNDYPEISSTRGKAFNYLNNPKILDSNNISGMQKRIYRLLGFRSPRYLLVEEENEKFIVKLYDPDNIDEVLLTGIQYDNLTTAEADLKYLMCNGSNEEKYKSKNESDKFYFEYLINDKESIAYSGFFENEQDRDIIKAKVIQFFKNRAKIENTPVVEFSNNLIGIIPPKGIEDTQHANEYYIQLRDPKGNSQSLLTGIKYPDRECAESIFHYFLSHGDNMECYQKHKEVNKYSFSLLNECGDIIASSPQYNDSLERDNKLNETIRFFRNRCDFEGFHLIEHILLRPHYGLESLLPVCLPNSGTPKTIDKKWYEFEIYLEHAVAIGRKPQWRFRLKDNNGKVIIKSEDYKHLQSCRHAITLIKKTLVEGGDIRILKSKHNKFYFNMVAANNEIFCTSNFWETQSEVIRILNELKEYFDSIQSQEEIEIKNFDKDPYSFRISIILPSWPEKFRNINFRRFVERTIRMETPAHIFPRICWIDFEQMKKFETAYKAWLKELPMEEPGKEISKEELNEKQVNSMNSVNSFIEVLFSLKNVYPVVKLLDCKPSDEDEPQVVLDYSALGII